MNHPVDRMRPVHPGKVLREDFLAPLGLGVNALAVALDVPATRIHEIVKERGSVSADTPPLAWQSTSAATQPHGWCCRRTMT